MRSEAMDGHGSKLGRELLAAIEGRSVGQLQPTTRKRASEKRANLAVVDDVNETWASWFVGSVGQGSVRYKLGQSVCLGCGFALTVWLEETRSRPRYCGGCGQEVKRYVQA